MALTEFEKIALGISGITAPGIGGFILVAPNAFYAGYPEANSTEYCALSICPAQQRSAIICTSGE